MNTRSNPWDTDDDGSDSDPYDSVTEGTPFAHHVLSPALLAGLSGAPLALSRVFHRRLFELLDGVGEFDGLIVTPAVIIGPNGSTRWLRASSWVRAWPGPDAPAMYDEHVAAGYEPAEAREHVTHTVMRHSLDLAAELGTNPSFTHASLPSIAHALLLVIGNETRDEAVRYVDALTDLAVDLLAMTSLEARLEGDATVIDTELLLASTAETTTSA